MLVVVRLPLAIPRFRRPGQRESGYSDWLALPRRLDHRCEVSRAWLSRAGRFVSPGSASIFLYCRAGAVIRELFAAIIAFDTRRKHFDDKAWRLHDVVFAAILWVTANGGIRVNIACFRDTYTQIGVIHTARRACEEAAEDACDIDFDNRVIGRAARKHGNGAINIFVARFQAVPVQCKIFFYGH